MQSTCSRLLTERLIIVDAPHLLIKVQRPLGDAKGPFRPSRGESTRADVHLYLAGARRGAAGICNGADVRANSEGVCSSSRMRSSFRLISSRRRRRASPGLSNRGPRWVIYGDVWRENAKKNPRRSDTIPRHKSGKARIEAPMREARSSPPAHRGARVIRTDALRFTLILQEPRGGQERKQDSEDDPDINAHQSSPAAALPTNSSLTDGIYFDDLVAQAPERKPVPSRPRRCRDVAHAQTGLA